MVSNKMEGETMKKVLAIIIIVVISTTLVFFLGSCKKKDAEKVAERRVARVFEGKNAAETYSKAQKKGTYQMDIILVKSAKLKIKS